MKYAIIGCGEMGHAHAKAYRNLGAEIVAVCDADSKRGTELANSIESCYEPDFETVLKKYKPDGISICTPPFHHLPALQLASHYPVSVLCEKPFVQSKEEIILAFNAAKSIRGAFRIGFKFRYEALYREARQIIQSNRIGKVQYVFISHFQPIAPRIWKMKTGIVRELLVHACDISCCFMNDFPTHISLDAQSLIPEFEGDDRAVMTLYFTDNRKAIIAGGYMPGFSRDPARLAKNDIAFQAVGEDGTISALRNGAITIIDQSGVCTYHPDENKTAFDYELEEFEQAILGKSDTGASLRESVASQLIIERAYEIRNSGTQHPIEIPDVYQSCFGSWARRYHE